ncbi:stage II sporulation protein D [Salibacterium salarium]|uniref:Stage II sporulation protein D n=1 Tax=Salibacterium salarium TaxID=284579 RepID=A0A428MU62_9BACI|nr:stage II sporulation protein D [Salibacterium salarium]RSL29675.1 stage II sporulation protein D [Salibacterium salarium]
MKKGVFFSVVMITLFFLIPILLVVIPGQGEDKVSESTQKVERETRQASAQLEETEERTVPVFRSETETVEETDLETYVAGVVASEMPVEFDVEALKAQALTARTYVAKQMASSSDINLPQDALVTDTTMHQVYKSEEELKEEWGDDFDWKMNKVKEAVFATQGQVLTYDGEPITAAFFSTSNGYTENAEDYWQNPEPYLQSVESPWDKASPRYENVQRMAVGEVEQKLNISIPAEDTGEIISRTDGNRVAEVQLGGETFDGRHIREELGLDSSDFQMTREGGDMVFATKGWGHGVGMSQYGADGMAREGRDYQDILQHYYKDVVISSL